LSENLLSKTSVLIADKITSYISQVNLTELLSGENLNGADHFGIYEAFRIYKKLVLSCLDQSGCDTLSDQVEESLLRMTLRKVWRLVKREKTVYKHDNSIRDHFKLNGDIHSPSRDEFLLEKQEEEFLYEDAVCTLIKINDTEDVELKALIIERAVSIAVESY